MHNDGSLDSGENELFNITQDPYEPRDLAAERAEMPNQLLGALEDQYAHDVVSPDA